jgi:hypothetical protein
MFKIIFVMVTLLFSINSRAADPTDACLTSVSQKPEYSKLTSKVAMLDGQPSMVMLANHHKASKEEKRLIANAEAEIEQCFTLGVDYRRAQYGPAIASILEQSIYSFKELVAELYSGTLTYGEFNQKRWQTDQEYNQKIASIVQNMKAAQQQRLLLEQQAKAAQQAQLDAQALLKEQQDADDRARQQAYWQGEADRKAAVSMQLMQSGFSMMCAANHTSC